MKQSVLLCLMAMILIACASADVAFAQRGTTNSAVAATDSLTGSGYFMTADTGDIPGYKYTAFSIESNGNEVDWFSVEVDWDADQLSLSSWEATPYLEVTLGIDTFTVNLTSTSIVLTFELTNPDQLEEGHTLLTFRWTTPCQETGADLALPMPNPDVDNAFSVYGGGTYRPATVDAGWVTLIAYTADIWPADASGPIGANVKVPLMAVNNFDPFGGITATVIYDSDRLSYQSFDTAGTWAGGGVGDITITTSADTLFIDDDGYYSETDTIVWFYLVFRNTMSDTGETATVTVDEWEQVGQCSEASAGETTDASGSVLTPQYSADLYWQSGVSLVTNHSGQIAIQMSNNFNVKMNTLDADSIASFRIDAQTWNKLDSTNVTVGDSVVRGTSKFFWMRLTGTASDIWVFQENTSKTSDSIPPAATKSNVAKLVITAKSQTGSQAVNFMAESADTIVNYYEKDSKLTAMSPAGITIHSTTVGSDSLFRLHGGSVTITSGGGGGSCPFACSWNGSEYVLEDVILTESESAKEGAPVVDYLPLTFPPVSVNGKYRLRIHEQEAEKTFLDDVRLIAVDHAPGLDVSVTPSGEVLLGAEYVLPIAAQDDRGENVLGTLRSLDDVRIERHGPGFILATYENDRGTRFAVTADDSLYENGDGGKQYCKIWAGPSGQQPPELNRMRVEVEDVSGTWHELPVAPPRLPLARVRPVLDLAGYDLGKTFRIRYSWDQECQLDQVSLMREVDSPHEINYLPVRDVAHSGDHPSAHNLQVADGKYTELVTGEYVDLAFTTPPVPAGMERSFVLASKGYYLAWYGHPDAGRPLEFGLNGNYPNPFNPSTTIRYSLASDAVVALDIFNILGQHVRTLVSGQLMPAGAYEATWDGRDSQGNVVGSGTYMYRLIAGDFTETRKMIMLK
jgi:hypothetical protein